MSLHTLRGLEPKTRLVEATNDAKLNTQLDPKRRLMRTNSEENTPPDKVVLLPFFQ